jgi:ubiquinone/menaquinone biosynthesis C-methylase UbiE
MSEKQTPAELARSFDAGAGEYRRVTSTLGNHVYEHVARENLRLCLAGRRFQSALDAGGGVGKWIPFLCEYADRVELLDISGESVRLAERELAALYPQVRFGCGDLEHTAFEGGAFDFVLAQGGVISYTPDPEALLAELRRVLWTGGLLWLDGLNSVGWALESPRREWKLRFAAVEKDLVFRMPDWDYPARMFRPSHLRGLIEGAGFRISAEYGSVILVNSLPLAEKCAPGFDPEMARAFCEQEVRLSRDERCRGAGKNISVLAVAGR